MAGTLIVSLDFELFWGMLDCSTLEAYQDHVLGGRKAIPQLLQIFEKYGIHATWATVGFQFARSREELEPFFPPEALRPTYEKTELNPYPWFDTIGRTEAEAPCFFAASLVEQIGKTPGQEIGSHTFCHYYCREKDRPWNSSRLICGRPGPWALLRAMTCNPLFCPGISVSRSMSG